MTVTHLILHIPARLNPSAAEKARALVKDYDLYDSDIREHNLNRFMSHIGERAAAPSLVE
jgi:hypothetical protein